MQWAGTTLLVGITYEAEFLSEATVVNIISLSHMALGWALFCGWMDGWRSAAQSVAEF